MSDRIFLQQAFDAMIYGNAAEREAARIALRDRLEQPERHELQAKGEHPAPCARHCEATAFQVVIKNLKAQLAQPEQEPHSWYSKQVDEWMTNKTRKEHERLNSYTHKFGKFDLALYTTPPQRKPLTDEQERKEFEQWYAENAFNFVANPIGSRECGLQWSAWKARAAHGTKGEA